MLQRVSPFARLPPHHLEALARAATITRVDAHQTLFRKGDRGRHFYGILRGLAKISTASADGGELVFAKKLIELAEEFGEAKADGIQISLGLSQSELAAMVRATRGSARPSALFAVSVRQTAYEFT